MGRNGQIVRRAIPLLFGMLIAAPPAAPASPSELDGMGLPYLLSQDVTTLRLLPGSGGAISPQVSFSTYGGIYVSGAGFSTSSSVFDGSSAQFLILSPGAVRFGYFQDGRVHSLLLAGESGWGFNLGFSDQFDKEQDRSDESFQDVGLPLRVREDGNEFSRRQVRLGFGWQESPGSDRLYEFGLGVSYIDLDVTAYGGEVSETDTVSFAWNLNSSPGYGADATFRTLAGSGLQIGLHFSYEDVNPETPIRVSDYTRRGASIQLGWRVDHPDLDDLVVGFVSRWNMTNRPTVYSSSNFIDAYVSRDTGLSGGFFAGGAKTVWDRLVLRAGVQGLGVYDERQRDAIEINEEGLQRTTYSMDANAYLNDPAVYLGASWSWRSLTFDGRINSGLSLDYPVARWSATAVF